MNNRTLIKLDDKIIEITQGKKGLKARELSVDEIAEVTLLDEGTEKLLKNDINRITNEAYEELTQEFKNNLKSNILQIAGFRKDTWGHNSWEVDHCNGRSSMVTQYIASKVQQMITAEMDKLLTPEEIQGVIQGTKKGLLKEFAEKFRYAVREGLYKKSQEEAATFLKDVVGKQMKKFQKDAIEKAALAFLGRPSARDDDESDD